MIDDAGEVALAAAIGDFVDANGDQAGKPTVVEVIGDDALNDPPDVSQAIHRSPVIGVLAICWAGHA